jgi:hypothetical protein
MKEEERATWEIIREERGMICGDGPAVSRQDPELGSCWGECFYFFFCAMLYTCPAYLIFISLLS